MSTPESSSAPPLLSENIPLFDLLPHDTPAPFHPDFYPVPYSPVTSLLDYDEEEEPITTTARPLSHSNSTISLLDFEDFNPTYISDNYHQQVSAPAPHPFNCSYCGKHNVTLSPEPQSKKKEVKKPKKKITCKHTKTNTLRNKNRRKKKRIVDREIRETDPKILEFESNYKCCICFNVFYRPIKIPTCKHVFCEICVQKTIIAGLLVTRIATNHVCCSLCRAPILDIPVPDSQAWNEMILVSNSYWTRDKLRTHIRLNKSHWNKHVGTARYQIDWEKVLTHNWNIKIENEYSTYLSFYLSDPSDAVLPTTEIEKHVKTIVRSKTFDRDPHAPNPHNDFEVAYRAKNPIYYYRTFATIPIPKIAGTYIENYIARLARTYFRDNPITMRATPPIPPRTDSHQPTAPPLPLQFQPGTAPTMPHALTTTTISNTFSYTQNNLSTREDIMANSSGTFSNTVTTAPDGWPWQIENPMSLPPTLEEIRVHDITNGRLDCRYSQLTPIRINDIRRWELPSHVFILYPLLYPTANKMIDIIIPVVNPSFPSLLQRIIVTFQRDREALGLLFHNFTFFVYANTNHHRISRTLIGIKNNIALHHADFASHIYIDTTPINELPVLRMPPSTLAYARFKYLRTPDTSLLDPAGYSTSNSDLHTLSSLSSDSDEDPALPPQQRTSSLTINLQAPPMSNYSDPSDEETTYDVNIDPDSPLITSLFTPETAAQLRQHIIDNAVSELD